MNTSPTTTETVRVLAHYALDRRLGHWTTARSFEVRAQRGMIVLDLRSTQIPEGDIEIHLDVERSALKLLVADDAVVDHWDLRLINRSRVKNNQQPKDAAGRRIVITGELRRGEIRVRRGGVAIVSAMLTKEYANDLRRANREGTMPTVDDPSRTAPGTPSTHKK